MVVTKTSVDVAVIEPLDELLVFPSLLDVGPPVSDDEEEERSSLLVLLPPALLLLWLELPLLELLVLVLLLVGP